MRHRSRATCWGRAPTLSKSSASSSASTSCRVDDAPDLLSGASGSPEMECVELHAHRNCRRVLGGVAPRNRCATTLALMLPFVYRMAPVQAFAFLLGMHSVVATTGWL